MYRIIVILGKVTSQGTAVEVRLAMQAADRRWGTISQYGILTGVLNLTSLFSAFSLFLCHRFPNFRQHPWRCPLLSWVIFFVELVHWNNIPIVLVYVSFFIYFFNGGVGSPANYIQGDKILSVFSFYWAKTNQTVPLQNCSANGIFRPNWG